MTRKAANTLALKCSAGKLKFNNTTFPEINSTFEVLYRRLTDVSSLFLNNVWWNDEVKTQMKELNRLISNIR